MRFLAVMLACLAWLQPVQAQAVPGGDPISWLGRISTAGQRLNYSGTFIYQSGRNFETSRIVHMVDANGEHERLEVLDGSPREVIRSNREVRCVLPDQKTIIIDRSGSQRAFPARLPASYAGIVESYRISLGEVGRVAGMDAQLIVLEPRDELRHGHMLWAELSSGLLLKSRMIDQAGEIIEQFTFTDINIGGDIDAGMLKPSYSKDGDWRVIDAQGSEVVAGSADWVLGAPVPGYTLKSMVKRPLGKDQGEILHLVFSDGLAAISVFIEPVDPDRVGDGLGPLSTGAINIYKRVLDGFVITALGEVPLLAVQRVAHGIEHAEAR